ncbi:MAG: carbohydrate ABC transporter permease [Geminicoccaceae bacterium]
MSADRTYWLASGVLCVLAALWLLPTLWMLSLSFQPNDLLARTTSNTAFGLIPAPFTVENYTRLFRLGLTPRWFLNSVIVASTMTALVLILSATAAYPLARIPFIGRNVVMAIILAGLLIPEQVIFIPLYTLFADWQLHNTYAAMIAPRLAVPVGVFLMVQFYRGIPAEIEEAAALDGAGRWTIFWKIMLPLARPALTMLGVLTFLYAWNDFLWPLVSAQRREMFTITVGLASLQSNFAQSEGLGQIMASGVIASLPVVIVFIVFQRFVMQGLSLVGSKQTEGRTR